MQVVACKPMASAIAVQVRGGVLLLAWVVCWQLQAGMTGRPRRYRIAVAKNGSVRERTPSARVARRKAPPSAPPQLLRRLHVDPPRARSASAL